MHTPGPWRYAGERVYEQQSDDVIAQPGKNFNTINLTQTLEANARLIASAPALLEALETIARFNTDGEELEDLGPYEMSIDDAFQTAFDCITIARDAIKQAKGE